jgi:hypothetical protein
MIKNALFITGVIFIALTLFLLEDCRFLIPYRMLLLDKYGVTMLIFAAALFLNAFTAVYLLCRKLFLKDTGRKLLHLDNQMRTSASLLDELSRYLAE